MLQSRHLLLRPLTYEDAADLLQLQCQNKAFFQRFAMVRPSSFYTLEHQQSLIKQWEQNMQNDVEYSFGIFHEHKLIGTISLFQVFRGSLQSAFIGYFVDKNYNGRGFGTEAVQLMVDYAFETLHLHRIEAGVMPHNIGSIRVLEKSGFHKEGLAIKNVNINGKWEDHQVLAIINPND
ncbi:GNAT family N-acetyltransferase [Caldibacillus lycopersici]|uniref:GNAT family N-acetyltransferase n=1 Tax=Perspicuibacillus lycopersici TaxID=1325689 RepID=A0AAE3IT83_9BACI|nr:GNAT family protein [Perspicuibacillus lycopersici]MCU9613024.1 GNAT family N-acetyltransferase [Perspicuibacillus lycopersici]